MEIFARSKINLALAITGFRNGLHELDTVMTESVVFDRIVIEKARGKFIVSYTDGRKYENDVTLKAIKLFSDIYGIEGVDVLVEKNIPEGAGLGGSSADAAAVVKGLEKIFDLPPTPAELLLKLGSDVPYCYIGGSGRVRGTGEIVEKLTLPKFYQVVLVPKGGVSTAECYALYDKIGGENIDIDKYLYEMNNKKTDELPPGKNALLRAAVKLNPNTGRALEILEDAGFTPGMTGSGSGVFGLETNEKEFNRKLEKIKMYTQCGEFASYTAKE